MYLIIFLKLHWSNRETSMGHNQQIVDHFLWKPNKTVPDNSFQSGTRLRHCCEAWLPSMVESVAHWRQPTGSSSLVNRGCVVVVNWCDDFGSSNKPPIQQSATAWFTCSECNPEPSVQPARVNICACVCIHLCVFILCMLLHRSLFSLLSVCMCVDLWMLISLLILFDVPFQHFFAWLAEMSTTLQDK